MTTDDTRPTCKGCGRPIRFVENKRMGSYWRHDGIGTCRRPDGRQGPILTTLDAERARHAVLVAAARAVIDARPYWGDLPAALEALEAALASEEAG
jgi:hypothetical protein